MERLPLFVAICLLPLSSHAALFVAAQNSPDRCKQRADVVCDGPLADDELRVAADQAWEERDVLVLASGTYRIGNTLRTRCSIRCEGDVWLKWVGEDNGSWMIVHKGVRGRSDLQDITNLRLEGNDKANGLLVRGVHRSTVLGLFCYRTLGGLRVEDGCCIFIRNLVVTGGGTPAFEASGFSGSVLDGLTAWRLKGDAPVVDVTSMTDMRQLVIEDCDTGRAPTVRWDNCKAGRLSGLCTERLRASAVLHVSNAFGATIVGVKCWQRPNAPIPMVVLVEKSEAVKVAGVQAWNVTDSIVKFDADSFEGDCVAERVREGYGRNVGVQPRHTINYAGRGDNYSLEKEKSKGLPCDPANG